MGSRNGSLPLVGFLLFGRLASSVSVASCKVLLVFSPNMPTILRTPRFQVLEMGVPQNRELGAAKIWTRFPLFFPKSGSGSVGTSWHDCQAMLAYTYTTQERAEVKIADCAL